MKLGEVFKITSGGTPSRKNQSYYKNGDIPWVKTGDLKTKYIEDTPEKITALGLEESSAKMFPPRTVLIAMYGATIGNCAILKISASSNQACAAFLPNDNIYEEYLYYYLRSIKKYFISRGQGGGQPNISGKILKNTKISLIPLEQQIRTATLLSRAEELITKRRESIRLLDDLLTSTFLEMFGNPAKNEKSWKKSKADTFIKNIVSGTSYSGEVKELLEIDEFGVLKVSAVTWGRFNPLEFKAVKKEKIKKAVVFVKKGDFLFSRANTKELVAASCIVDDDYPKLFLPDKLWRIDFNENICNRYYFNYLLKINDFRKLLTRQATGTSGSMLNISMKKLRNTKIPLPPITIQNKFAKIYKKIESLRVQYETSLQELENLYGSLSQRTFRGELDVSKVPIHHELRLHETITVQEAVEPKILQAQSKEHVLDLKTFQQLIKKEFSSKFTFDELQGMLAKKKFDSKPEYLQLKNLLVECLEGKRPFLHQKFGQPNQNNNNPGKKEKQIFFSVTR